MKYIVGIIVFILCFILCYVYVPFFTETTTMITVSERDRIDNGNGKGYHVIYTENETFKNQNTNWYMKYNSTDIQGKFRIGNTYIVDVYGFKLPIFSQYRNIIRIRETVVKNNDGLKGGDSDESVTVSSSSN